MRHSNNQSKIRSGYLSHVAKLALVPLLLISGMLVSCLKKNPFPASGTVYDIIALVDLKDIYKGQDLVLDKNNMAGATKITGVVVSDAASGNIPKGILAIQQTSRSLTRAIELNFGSVDVGFKPGDSLTVDVNGATMSRQNGSLQIKVNSLASVNKITSNVPVAPTQVSLQTLDAKFNEYESMLITIAHVTVVSTASTMAGDLDILDVVNKKGIIHTETTAAFAGQAVPVNASYLGIAKYYNSTGNGTDGAKKELWPTNGAGITDQSGPVYENFPEDFENPDAVLLAAAGYSTKTGLFKTGSYTLTNAAIGQDVNDYPSSGKIAIRYNQNLTTPSWTTMNFDLPSGASKVTIWAGSYGASADLGSIWRLEYSQNQGLTWSQVGQDILTISKTKEQFTFLMDLKGNVRFRFGKIGNGVSTTNNQNGRFSMDDFAVYKNTGGSPITNPVPPADLLLGWQFGTPGTTGSEITINSTTTNANLTTAVLSRGPGLGVSGLVRSFASFADGVAIPTTLDIAYAQNTYYQVVTTVKTGYKLSLTSIDGRIRKTAAGANRFRWYYSLDGTNFKQTTGTGDVGYDGTDTEGADMPTYYIYGTPELQNIPEGTTVTLRMYCWGFTNLRSGTFSIGRTPVSTVNNSLSLKGKVELK